MQDTYVYELIQGTTVVYIGMSNDTKRREDEHRNEGKQFDYLKVVAGPMTEDDARAEEKRRLDEYRRTHGDTPKYND